MFGQGEKGENCHCCYLKFCATEFNRFSQNAPLRSHLLWHHGISRNKQEKNVSEARQKNKKELKDAQTNHYTQSGLMTDLPAS